MKVLVPVDGTPRSEIILAWAPCLQALPDLELHVLHCAPSEEPGGTRHTTNGVAIACEKYAETLASRITGGEVVAHTDVGHPGLNIVRYARTHKVDLIAMVTRAKAGLSRMLMGSTAAEVMEALPGPFVMVGPAVKIPEMTPSIRRILVPMDGSPASARILADLPFIARPFNAEVTLLHVQQETSRSMETQLQAWCDSVTMGGVRCTVRMALGSAAIEIVNQVLQPGHDLVAMTTTGRSGIQRLLLGSVAEEVLRKCPVPLFLRRAD